MICSACAARLFDAITLRRFATNFRKGSSILPSYLRQPFTSKAPASCRLHTSTASRLRQRSFPSELARNGISGTSTTSRLKADAERQPFGQIALRTLSVVSRRNAASAEAGPVKATSAKDQFKEKRDRHESGGEAQSSTKEPRRTRSKRESEKLLKPERRKAPRKREAPTVAKRREKFESAEVDKGSSERFKKGAKDEPQKLERRSKKQVDESKTTEGRSRGPGSRSKKPDTKEEEGEQEKPERLPWQLEKEAVKRKLGGEEWRPFKRLSPDALEGIRALHAQSPTQFTTPVLAKQFEVSPEVIRRILKGKWRPNPEEEEARRLRWSRRGERIWKTLAAKGVRPPKKWRELGIGGAPPGGVPKWKAYRKSPVKRSPIRFSIIALPPEQAMHIPVK